MGQFALKHWPIHTPAPRVDEVHAVQQHAHRSLASVPQLRLCSHGIPRLTLGTGLHFELSTWMPGSPFMEPSCSPGNESAADSDLSHPALVAVRAGAAAIARFHQATASLGVSYAAAPAVAQRLERLQELPRELSAAIPFAQQAG
ncbi:MAG: hypothetical protein ACO1RT_05915, partial [Planctomycetaceae bacterium]